MLSDGEDNHLDFWHKKVHFTAFPPIYTTPLAQIPMTLTRNAKAIFNSIPEAYPVLGETVVYDDTVYIDLENVPLNGGILIKTLRLSIDPYLRGRMRDINVKSYARAFHLGKPLDNFGVGVVFRSESSKIKVGDHVYGMISFEEYSVRTDVDSLRVLENKEGLDWSRYVSVLGMPGLTAYGGWKEHSEAKRGDTVFVTAGSGPVGSIVIQTAKLEGLKVIASAGSDEKVAFLREIGADVAFNYKTSSTLEVLQNEGPIDIYWDNVGGESFEAAIETANNHARIIVCGMIGDYNGETYHVKNLQKIFAKELHIHGFLILKLGPKYEDQFYAEVPPQVASGKVRVLEDPSVGLDKVGDAIIAVLTGKNYGKSFIVVAEK